MITIYDNKSNTISDKNIENILNIIENNTPNLTLNMPKNKILVTQVYNVQIDEYRKEMDDWPSYRKNMIIQQMIDYLCLVWGRQKNITTRI